MRVSRVLLVSVCAAALGAVLAITLLVLREAAPPPRDRVTPAQRGGGQADSGGATDVDAPDRTEPESPAVVSLSERISSSDVEERVATALALLRKGPAALSQARALRPRGREGQDLTERLVLALDRMSKRRRATDYERLPEYLKQELWLLDARSVVPDEALRDERRRYWAMAVDAQRARLRAGVAHAGEVALAEVELALVRGELGEIDSDEYAAIANERLPRVEEWLTGLRERKGIARAEIEQHAARLERLRP